MPNGPSCFIDIREYISLRQRKRWRSFEKRCERTNRHRRKI